MKLENERYIVTFVEKGGEIQSFTDKEQVFSICGREMKLIGVEKILLYFQW